jgi:hypothetical protein
MNSDEFIVVYKSPKPSHHRIPIRPAAPVPENPQTLAPQTKITPHADSPSIQPLPILHPPSQLRDRPDPANFSELVKHLRKQGHSTENCEDALRFSEYDLEKAANLLGAGLLEQRRIERSKEWVFAQILGDGVTIRPPINLCSSGDGSERLSGGEEGDKGAEFSTEELEIIERFVQNGFDREIVIELFRNCDRDENLTRHCLMNKDS